MPFASFLIFLLNFHLAHSINIALLPMPLHHETLHFIYCVYFPWNGMQQCITSNGEMKISAIGFCLTHDWRLTSKRIGENVKVESTEHGKHREKKCKRSVYVSALYQTFHKESHSDIIPKRIKVTVFHFFFCCQSFDTQTKSVQWKSDNKKVWITDKNQLWKRKSERKNEGYISTVRSEFWKLGFNVEWLENM